MGTILYSIIICYYHLWYCPMVRSLQTVLVIRVSFSFIAVPLLQQFTPPNIVLNHFMAEVGCVFWHCFPCRQDSTNPARISLQCRRPRGFLLVAVNIAGSHIYITYKNFQKAEAILMMSPRTIKSKHYVLRKWSFLMRSSPSTYINHHFSRD